MGVRREHPLKTSTRPVETQPERDGRAPENLRGLSRAEPVLGREKQRFLIQF